MAVTAMALIGVAQVYALGPTFVVLLGVWPLAAKISKHVALRDIVA